MGELTALKVAYMETVGTLPLESLELGLRPRDLGELRGFVGVAEAQVSPDASANLNDLFARIADAVEMLALSAIEKRTAAEFSTTVSAVFNDYARLLRARSDLIQVLLKGDRVAEHVVSQSINELENELKEKGPRQFGEPITEQAVFATWTLRKTADLLWKLPKTPVLSTESKNRLEKLGPQFALYVAWAQFHLECLTASMRKGRPIYPPLHPAVMDGLRAEVNAYSLARQIADILSPINEESDQLAYSWDAEDEELMTASMEDIESGL